MVIIEMDTGSVMKIELDPKAAPATVANFKKLVKEGFYDGLIFHRVIKGFMIQGGDPTGTGRGGPGYNFADEFHPELRFDRPYLLAMANAGPGTNGSQFFINYDDSPLAPAYTYFGTVTDKGMETVDKIRQVKTGRRGMFQDVPVEPVVILDAIRD